MADLTENQAAGVTKIIGSDATGVEQTPVQSTSGGGFHVNLRNNAGTEIINLPVINIGATDGTPIGNNGDSLNVIGKVTSVPLLSAPGIVVRVIPFEPPAYGAAAAGFIPAAAATDVFTITGSASKIIRIRKLRFTGTTTSGSAIRITSSLIKRSTVDTGGTFTVVASAPNDSLNAAATATVRSYTVNPTALGTLVAAMRSETTAILNYGMNGGYLLYDFTDNPIILRGVSEQLCVNLGGVTVTGPVFSVAVEWVEV